MNIIKKITKLTINEKTKENIIRKSEFIDKVQFDDKKNTPLFSWLDISVTELCNRGCEFCPRVDSAFYPNQNLHISIKLVKKITDELRSLKYKGTVTLCGFGEPLLHPKIIEIIKCFQDIRIELATNGDRLTQAVVRELFDSGLNYICISMYDGPKQVEYFKNMMKKSKIPEENYVLRDRWHNEKDSFGLKLTNRSGSINFGPSIEEFKGKPCFYTAYSMTIDWNGDVLLCVQDWNKKIKFGNLTDSSLISIWQSTRMHKYRKNI